MARHGSPGREGAWSLERFTPALPSPIEGEAMLWKALR